MRYFIGYLIEGEAGEYYKKITADLSERFGIKNLSEYIPLHLTLKAPFETGDISVIEKVLEDTAVKEETSPLVIDGFERFGSQSRTIFLGIKDNVRVQEKAEKLLHLLSGFGNYQKPIPLPLKLHASIARYLSPEQSQNVWDYVSSLPAPHFDLQFNNLTLFVHQDNHWEIQKTFYFHDN
ncbi:MAG: 2'-5' RNA ligase family protein [Patescibacteria group bacterium]|nr:2'-5' RNA ligase family protein [bacterium]MDZ4240579.1 2'-5' RNA ligase family protein [Patescibacteria group bacterium]